MPKSLGKSIHVADKRGNWIEKKLCYIDDKNPKSCPGPCMGVLTPHWRWNACKYGMVKQREVIKKEEANDG